MLRVLKWLVALAFTVAAAVGAVVLLATYEELTATLPPIERLLDYDPPQATRVYADDGSLIEEFFRERRYRVAIADIPPLVRNAFLAAEDADFFAHRGVDFMGIARAALANFQAGSVVQGASTITQQVVKALLLSPERSYERKLKEILLSVRLEQHLSKDQILELYLNQIYLGDGNHGVAAAARNYFGKSVHEMTAAEAAMLAGLPAAPSRYSPNRAPEAARKRQLYVLRRMLEERFLSAGEYQSAIREELHLLTRRQQPTNSVRNYYTEAVRLQLEDMFGAEAPYNQGYSVYTAMQPRLQALAEVAVRNGIERIDKTLGYRGPIVRLAEAEQRAHIEKLRSELAGGPVDSERIYEAVVTSVSPSKLGVSIGAWQRTLDISKLRWNSAVKTRSFRVGDVVEVRARETAAATVESRDIGIDAEIAVFHLTQTPKIEAALVAIDMEQGGIAAMVGGYDFLGSQFNRALQAQRQPGSAFKPFVYAAALDNGYTAASILQDSPVEYMDHDKVWAPRNYTRDFKGPIRLRTALEQSRNVVSVKLVDKVGVKTVVDYLGRFRLGASFGPNLSIALGTTEMTLRSLTEGFTAFANGGVKVEPVVVRRIEDKDGVAFFSDEPRRREVLSPQTAAVMTYILEGVVERGTGTSIKALDRPVAGKTGTTNEQRDAWFIGYTPNLAVGVWVGFDDPNQTMGKMGTGGRVAAPIWLDFMKPALAGTSVRDFDIPDDISCVNIDPGSGRRAGQWTSKPFLECFKAGTEPGVYVASVPDDGHGDPMGGDPNSPPATAFVAPAEDDSLPADPRWPSVRNPEEAEERRWPPPRPDHEAPAPLYPYEPAPRREPERLRAEAVPTESGGVEVRLFRDERPPPPVPPPVSPPPTAPASPPPTRPAPPARLWAPEAIEMPRSPLRGPAPPPAPRPTDAPPAPRGEPRETGAPPVPSTMDAPTARVAPPSARPYAAPPATVRDDDVRVPPSTVPAPLD
ncbi:MAG: PBP1A family penicillin-binding protein [Candidatus Binatia bacterium]